MDQTSYKNELIKIKNDIKKLKKEKKKLKKEAKNKKEKVDKNIPPKLTVLEEIGNAVTHGVMIIFSIIALVLMLIYSSNVYEVVGASIYGASLITMFTSSTLYHSFKHGLKVKKVFRIFDYTSIYLLIGGTFAPILLILLEKNLGITLLIIQWIVICIGIVFVAIFGPGRLKWLHFPLYFVLGWVVGIFVIPTMFNENINLLWWILAGGIVYSLGMIPFCMKEKKSAHFIWHFVVMLGAILQFIGIFTLLYL